MTPPAQFSIIKGVDGKWHGLRNEVAIVGRCFEEKEDALFWLRCAQRGQEYGSRSKGTKKNISIHERMRREMWMVSVNERRSARKREREAKV